MHGVVVGVVTDNEDPKDLGRVKLQFPWRDADDESYWARIATPMAGSEYGAYFLPEVDDEVLVAFENGDIHTPYVVGSLWNGEQPPPQRNDGENDVREIRSRSDHTIAFDDGDDGRITIQTSDGHEIVVDEASGSETIALRDDGGKNEITLDSSKGHISIDASKKLTLSATSIELDAKQAVDISGATVDVASKTKLKLSSKAKLDVSSGGLMGIDATGPLTIEGLIISLN